MQALADSLRAEVADYGIEVTTICPGYVKTNLSLNALTGSGSRLGRMTRNIETGLSSEYVAERVFKAVQNREKDLVISPLIPKIAIFLRYLTPTIYFFIMRRMGRAYNKRSSGRQ
jgi:dehydrogenase/reductase SDR family protein 7B